MLDFESKYLSWFLMIFLNLYLKFLNMHYSNADVIRIAIVVINVTCVNKQKLKVACFAINLFKCD